MTLAPYVRKITVTAATVPHDADGVPVLVRLTADDELAMTARGDGRDIHFRDSSGTLLPATVGYRPYLEPRANLIWTWFNRAEARYFNGSTYITWYDLADYGWYIGKLTHSTGDWETTRLAVSPNTEIDDHNNPPLAIDSSGYIYVFCGEHSQDVCTQYKSDSPEDISAFTSTDLAGLDSVFTYPQAEIYGDDNIFLSWRGTSNQARYYSVSTDGGANWATKKTLFANGSERPYLHQCVDDLDNDVIHFVASTAHADEVTAGDCDIFHFKLDLGDGNFYESDDTLIGAAGTATPGPSNTTLVEDATTGGYNFWNADIVVNSGVPYVVYSEHRSSQDIRYRYARWTGSAWDANAVCQAGQSLYGWDTAQPSYVPGLCIADDPTRLYASVDAGDKSLELREYYTTDGGSTWNYNVMSRANGTSPIRPTRVRGGGSDLKCIYLYGRYEEYEAASASQVADCGLAGWPNLPAQSSDLLAVVEVDFDGSTDVEIYMCWGGVTVASTAPLSSADYLSIGDVSGLILSDDNSFLDGATGLTIIAAFKMGSASTGSQAIAADWQASAGDGAHFLFNLESDEKIRAVVVDSTGTTQLAKASDLATVDTNWHSGALRMGSNTLYCYLDGNVSSTTDTLTGGIYSPATAGPMYALASPHNIATTEMDGGELELLGIWTSDKGDAWVKAATITLVGDAYTMGATLNLSPPTDHLAASTAIIARIVGMAPSGQTDTDLEGIRRALLSGAAN